MAVLGPARKRFFVVALDDRKVAGAQDLEAAIGMRPEGAEVAECEHLFDAARPRDRERRLERQVVGLDPAQERDAAEASQLQRQVRHDSPCTWQV